MTRRSLFIELDPDDAVQLEHLVRQSGQPRSVVAAAAVHAAFAAGLELDLPALPDTDRS